MNSTIQYNFLSAYIRYINEEFKREQVLHIPLPHKITKFLRQFHDTRKKEEKDFD